MAPGSAFRTHINRVRHLIHIPKVEPEQSNTQPLVCRVQSQKTRVLPELELEARVTSHTSWGEVTLT